MAYPKTLYDRTAVLTLSFLQGTDSQSTDLNHLCFFTSSAPFWKKTKIIHNNVMDNYN